MAELDAITKALRQQRKDLDELVERTSSRTTETNTILAKIEELRARSERSTRVFSGEPEPKKSD